MPEKPSNIQTWKERENEIFELLEFANKMITVEQRLESFKNANWAYSDDSACNVKALANAGWFYYPKSQCPNEAYCFITLKCLGWEEDDDPWEEQKKRKKGHPLWRKFVPAVNDYEIISKATSEYTVEELALLSAVVLEGHIKYKVDSLSDAVYEHAQALKDREHKKMATSSDFDQTISGFESKVKMWEKRIQTKIDSEAKRLTDIKRTHTERFRNLDDLYKLKYMKDADQKNQLESIGNPNTCKYVNAVQMLQNSENEEPANMGSMRNQQLSRQSIVLRQKVNAPPSAQKSKSYLY